MDVARLSEKVTYKMNLQGGQSRMKEAILYVCKHAKDHTFFGLTKLNKILWRADFQSYRDRKIPVTGRQYQRQVNGPVPVDMPPLLNEMLAAGLLEWGQTEIPNERRAISVASPLMRWFSPDDIRYLDEAITYYEEYTATNASLESHGTAWEVRENGDPIPYEAALLSDEDLPKEIKGRILALAKQKGWQSN